MKQIIAAVAFLLIPVLSMAQKTEVYDTKADAKADIVNAVQQASKEGKHVFLQIGGNWCPWCIKFHNFVEADSEIKAFLSENFEVVKVNYDRENRQEDLMAEMEFPQRFGFPVFVVLNKEGERIHTQNSAFLEKNKNYDKETVMRFLKNWAPAAISPDTYKK